MPSVTRHSDEHDDHDDIPNPIPEQCHDTFADEVGHDTFEDEVGVDDHQEQTDNSDDARDSEVRNNIRYFFL